MLCYGLSFSGFAIKFSLVGSPSKNGTFDFVGLCSDQQLFCFTCLERASFPHYNNTKIFKFGWKLFMLWVISYGLSFSRYAINLLSCLETRGNRANTEGDRPLEITHKIKSSQPNFMILMLIYMYWEENALSSKVKKITVDQSKVLKNWLYRLFRYFWATRYFVRPKWIYMFAIYIFTMTVQYPFSMFSMCLICYFRINYFAFEMYTKLMIYKCICYCTLDCKMTL